ncbi:MAG: hypothetical protein KJO69_02435 [Gammaproteobacteria bacterium]|nr:hypothetical protein [Gammaproteobacteria bacterium]
MKTLIPFNTRFNAATAYKYDASINTVGMTDGKQCTIFARIRTDADLGTNQFILRQVTGRVSVAKVATTDKIQFILSDSGNANISNITSSSAVAASSNYVTLMISVDGTDSTKDYLIIDGAVDASATITGTSTNDIDLTTATFAIGSTPTPNQYFDGVISVIGLWAGYISSNDALSTCFDSDGNFTDMGPDGALWFGEPCNLLHKSNHITFGRNDGIAPDAALLAGKPADSGTEARRPVEQVPYRYKAVNDIDVVNNGDGTSTITSNGSGFPVWSVIDTRGFKVGDYIYVTGSTGAYPITAVTTSSITVTGSLTAYAKSATANACVFRVRRRPVL